MRVVWFKRDLRIDDHLPLLRCAESGPFVALYVYEPRLLASPEVGANQHCFLNACLASLDHQLRGFDAELVRVHAPIRDVLDALRRDVGMTELHSHIETGNQLTYRRDKAVAAWCRANQVRWVEAPTSDVCRPHPKRDGWSKRWYQLVHRPLIPTPKSMTTVDVSSLKHRVEHLSWQDAGLEAPAPERQTEGGSDEAHRLLRVFLRERTGRYPKQMSAPLLARDACSRLSPHLALGTISSRQVIHQLERARRLVTSRAVRDAYEAFESRIAWRGHFMQRLEDCTALETQCLHPATESIRRPGVRVGEVRLSEQEIARRLTAWQSGRTGFPMVDACIRSLRATGWLNFRMRAMIVSFACYTLWLDWRLINAWLARQFTDYEPGIHLNQLQMQSGSTGINQLRIYNPVMQAKRHDPTGAFIRTWVPELASAPTDVLHRVGEPNEAMLHGLYALDYPMPIVNYQTANKAARTTIERLRRLPESRRAARDVNARLGSRKNRGPKMGRR